MRVNSPNDSFYVSQGQINVLTKKSNYIPFIVSLEQGYCLLLSPIKPFSHCFLPKTTNKRQHGTSKVRRDRAGSEILAGPGSSVIAQQVTEIKGCLHVTQTLSLVTSECPHSTTQARWHWVDPKPTQVNLHGQGHHTPWAAAPVPGCPTQIHSPSIPALKLVSA